MIFWPTLASLAIVLCVGISHKVHVTIRFTLASTTVACSVMLLTLGVVVPPSLPYLVIIRFGILGTIRISIFHQSGHEGPHVGAMTLHPSQLQLQGSKPAVAF